MAYAAPEILCLYARRKPPDDMGKLCERHSLSSLQPDPAFVDAWSFGATMYTLAAGVHSFLSASPHCCRFRAFTRRYYSDALLQQHVPSAVAAHDSACPQSNRPPFPSSSTSASSSYAIATATATVVTSLPLQATEGVNRPGGHAVQPVLVPVGVPATETGSPTSSSAYGTHVSSISFVAVPVKISSVGELSLRSQPLQHSSTKATITIQALPGMPNYNDGGQCHSFCAVAC